MVDTGRGLCRSLGDCRLALPESLKYQMVRTRDVDGISRSRDIPRLSRDQNIPGVKIPGIWLFRNPGIFNPRILNPGKSRYKKSRDILFPKIPECFKEVPGYPGIFSSFSLSNLLLCLVHTKSRIENMAFPVVEFSRKGYKTRMVFG